MHNNRSTSRSAKPRALLVAYACSPTGSMESRLGWKRAVAAAARFDLEVIYSLGPEASELEALPETRGASFHQVPHGFFDRLCCQSGLLYYAGYRTWHRRAYERARLLEKQRPFDLVHQVNFCGYREPGECWRLNAPFVWGPVGGAQSFPLRFLSTTNFSGGLLEVLRSLVNGYQLRFCPRVHQAARRARVVLAANTDCQRLLQNHTGREVRCDLETGIDPIEGIGPKPPRDTTQPLRVLWAGRLKTWKGLPLLIEAVARIPSEKRPIVRVLGEGDRERSWRRLAKTRGVADRFEWVGWPPYDQTLPHYRWADVFAFTSLRDTSGTGLLEALGSGTPIVGLNHSGAGDIMTPDCAVALPLKSTPQAIEGFAAALTDLADDPERLLRLSRGALRRSEDFHWSKRIEVMDAVYTEVLNAAPVVGVPSSAPKSHPTLRPSRETQLPPELSPDLAEVAGRSATLAPPAELAAAEPLGS